MSFLNFEHSPPVVTVGYVWYANIRLRTYIQSGGKIRLFSDEHTVNTTLPIGIYFGLNGVRRICEVFSDDNYEYTVKFTVLAKLIFSHFFGIVFLFNMTR